MRKKKKTYQTRDVHNKDKQIDEVTVSEMRSIVCLNHMSDFL